jgi:hypothetical protein
MIHKSLMLRCERSEPRSIGRARYCQQSFEARLCRAPQDEEDVVE